MSSIWLPTTFATLCTAFAVLAVVIACVGLYGTMAYAVARRTNEMGLRMALGAQRGTLLWMVMRQALSMALIGLAIGVPAAWANAHVVESFLFGIKAKDPLALSLAPAVLLMAALAAGYRPAWRASRDRPLEGAAGRVATTAAMAYLLRIVRNG